jgi:hypothetical protein
MLVSSVTRESCSVYQQCKYVACRFYGDGTVNACFQGRSLYRAVLSLVLATATERRVGTRCYEAREIVKRLIHCFSVLREASVKLSCS